jgi:hypothetical protein
LFQLYRPAERRDPEPGYLFTASPSAAFPEVHVVVDPRDGQPLRNLPELPIVISTKVDGWLMEAWMRLNLHIEYEDIIMRMPHLDAEKWAKKDAPGGFKNTLSGRRRDFRKLGRCFSWELNTSLSSAYDRTLREDIAADPEAAQHQSTRSLKDLSKPERTKIEDDARKRKVSASDFNTEAGPSKKQKIPPLPPPQLPLTGSPVPHNQGNQGPGTGFYNPWFPQIEAVPGDDKTSITPADLGPDVPDVPELTTLLYGPPLFALLAANGARYTPDSRLPAMSMDLFDARYTLAQSAEDRRQLFFALYPLMAHVIKVFDMERFSVELNTYAQAWNQLEHQFIHAAYRATHDRDLDTYPGSLVPMPEWTGAIGNFDLPRLPMHQWHDHAGRDARKVQSAPYTMWDEFVAKGQAVGVVDQERVVVWPSKLWVDSGYNETTGGFVLRLSDFE